MADDKQRLECVVAQLKQERETAKILENLNLNDGRKEQILEKRRADVRARYGLSMDDSIKI